MIITVKKKMDIKSVCHTAEDEVIISEKCKGFDIGKNKTNDFKTLARCIITYGHTEEHNKRKS